MQFLNDEYTLNIDKLANRQQIANIRDLILDAPTPFSIGISGRWGSGKSSIMKYLMASLGGKPIKHKLNFEEIALEEESDFKKVFENYCNSPDEKKEFNKRNIHTIWFNPWENETHQEPMVALLQAIHHHFSFFASNKQRATKLMNVTFKAGLDMLEHLKLAKFNTVQTIGEKYEQENFQYIDRTQKFKFIFQEAIETLLKQGNAKINDTARIVIFVDDLDRCEDTTVAKLLKEIKQYLATKRCIFVFGYDRHHIEKSLSLTQTKTSKETRAYLEKLFQSTFYITAPSKEQLQAFTKKHIEEYRFIPEAYRERFADFIASIIDPNPRRIKNFLMAIYFHIHGCNVAQDADDAYDLETLEKLALIAYLKLFYESVYSVLENQPELKETLINALNNNNIFDITSKQEYYFKLEFKNHLTTTDPYQDVLNSSEEHNTNFAIEYKKEFEEKFLGEIYEMQGKHKSFSTFSKTFFEHFQDESIEPYL